MLNDFMVHGRLKVRIGGRATIQRNGALVSTTHVANTQDDFSQNIPCMMQLRGGAEAPGLRVLLASVTTMWQ